MKHNKKLEIFYLKEKKKWSFFFNMNMSFLFFYGLFIMLYISPSELGLMEFAILLLIIANIFNIMSKINNINKKMVIAK